MSAIAHDTGLATYDRRVIILPGPGMAKAPDWKYNSTNWLEALTDDVSQRVQVSWYEYQIGPTSDDSALQQLLAEGHTMLHYLNQWLQASVRRGSHANVRAPFADHPSRNDVQYSSSATVLEASY